MKRSEKIVSRYCAPCAMVARWLLCTRVTTRPLFLRVTIVRAWYSAAHKLLLLLFIIM